VRETAYDSHVTDMRQERIESCDYYEKGNTLYVTLKNQRHLCYSIIWIFLIVNSFYPYYIDDKKITDDFPNELSIYSASIRRLMVHPMKTKRVLAETLNDIQKDKNAFFRFWLL
jgi:hypothetical protein